MLLLASATAAAVYWWPQDPGHALMVAVAVLNEGVSREAELAHLQRLPGQSGLSATDLADRFLRLRFADHTLKWERHSEFTRYVLVQPLPEGAGLGASNPDLLGALVTPPGWLAASCASLASASSALSILNLLVLPL